MGANNSVHGLSVLVRGYVSFLSEKIDSGDAANHAWILRVVRHHAIACQVNLEATLACESNRVSAVDVRQMLEEVLVQLSSYHKSW